MNKLNETILRQTIRTILVEDCGCGPVRQGMLHGIGFSTEPHRSSVKVDDHSGRDMDYGDYEGKMVKNNIEIIVGQAKELYDLSSDPSETTNVIDDHPKIARRAQTLLEAIRTEPASRNVALD